MANMVADKEMYWILHFQMIVDRVCSTIDMEFMGSPVNIFIICKKDNKIVYKKLENFN